MTYVSSLSSIFGSIFISKADMQFYYIILLYINLNMFKKDNQMCDLEFYTAG